MKSIVKILAVVVFVLICAVPVNLAFADESISPTSWMSHIDGKKKINEITIPGTHDSGCEKMCLLAGTLGEVQNYSIESQVWGGVRLFDMRLGGEFEWNYFSSNRHLDPKTPADLIFYHGDLVKVDCRCFREIDHIPLVGREVPLTFVSVLNELFDFLDRNPSETVIIAPRAEVGDKSVVYRVIRQAIELYGDRIYKSTDRVPTLDEVRGKVVLLDLGNIGIGLPIRLAGTQTIDNTDFVTSDLYECRSTDEKVEELKKAFSNTRKTGAGLIFTSGYTMIRDTVPDSYSMSNAVNSRLVRMLERGASNGWIFSDWVVPCMRSYRPEVFTKKDFIEELLSEVLSYARNPGSALLYTQIRADGVYMMNF